MHWGWKLKERGRFIDNGLTRQMQPINYASGRTLLVPLEHYQHRDRYRWPSLVYDILIHTLAFYGLFKLVLEPAFKHTMPYLRQLWKHLL